MADKIMGDFEILVFFVQYGIELIDVQLVNSFMEPEF
jgi:hypothetical protein